MHLVGRDVVGYPKEQHWKMGTCGDVWDSRWQSWTVCLAIDFMFCIETYTSFYSMCVDMHEMSWQWDYCWWNSPTPYERGMGFGFCGAGGISCRFLKAQNVPITQSKPSPCLPNTSSSTHHACSNNCCGAVQWIREAAQDATYQLTCTWSISTERARRPSKHLDQKWHERAPLPVWKKYWRTDEGCSTVRSSSWHSSGIR